MTRRMTKQATGSPLTYPNRNRFNTELPLCHTTRLIRIIEISVEVSVVDSKFNAEINLEEMSKRYFSTSGLDDPNQYVW